MAMDLELERFCVAIVRDGPDAVAHADREGTIRFWNGGAERIFGFSEAEALGRSLDLIVPETLRPRHWAAFHETMRTGRTRYGEGGRLSGVVAVVRDVTKRASRRRQPCARSWPACGRLDRADRQGERTRPGVSTRTG
jgi:PAS domain-containing protein